MDIGATEYIHQRLLEQRATGTAILLISEDLDEIRSLSDRIAVMYEGHIIGIVQRGEATVEEIGLMMAGVASDKIASTDEQRKHRLNDRTPDTLFTTRPVAGIQPRLGPRARSRTRSIHRLPGQCLVGQPSQMSRSVGSSAQRP